MAFTLADRLDCTFTTMAGVLKFMQRRVDDDAHGRWIRIVTTVLVILFTNAVTGVIAGYFGGQVSIAVHQTKLVEHERRLNRTDERIDYMYQRNR